MKTLITERLILRPFEATDFEAVHAYASVAENVQYMVWGPNEESPPKHLFYRLSQNQRKSHAKIINMLLCKDQAESLLVHAI